MSSYRPEDLVMTIGGVPINRGITVYGGVELEGANGDFISIERKPELPNALTDDLRGQLAEAKAAQVNTDVKVSITFSDNIPQEERDIITKIMLNRPTYLIVPEGYTLTFEGPDKWRIVKNEKV